MRTGSGFAVETTFIFGGDLDGRSRSFVVWLASAVCMRLRSSISERNGQGGYKNAGTARSASIKISF
jgi:hypothetical protein